MVIFADALRAQYFIRTLDSYIALLKSNLLSCADIVENLYQQIAEKVDQIILPVIAFEIADAKNKNLLLGRTSIERYDSFFIHEKAWTRNARILVERYPFLFEMIETYIRTSVQNIIHCLRALSRDRVVLKRKFKIRIDDDVSRVIILDADRHRGGRQPVMIEFASGTKIVFKPRDISGETIFAEFVERFNLMPPYDIYCVSALSMNGYGWIEFIPYSPCCSMVEVRNYFKRCGTLLAICDVLNYCDGHFENLIACGQYPVLIDMETIFHFFGEVKGETEERSVLYTGLIEKPPEPDSGRGFTSAFQSPPVGRFEFLYPFPMDDHSDRLQVRFRGFSNKRSSNLPFTTKGFSSLKNYMTDFIDGFGVGYSSICRRADIILANKELWARVASLKTRQLLRHTLYYELLIRKIQQPEACVSKEEASNLVSRLLKMSKMDDPLNRVVECEVSDILNCDVPYFYHCPGQTDLYNGNGYRYCNYFSGTALDEVRAQLLKISVTYLKRQEQILRNVIPSLPNC